jgi:hypothetical protein
MSPDEVPSESSPEALSRADQLLMKEYDNAKEMTYHVDGLRDRLTVFFVTIAGIAAAGLSVVLRRGDEDSTTLLIVTALFLLVGALGGVVTVIVARLRSVQIEHFRILSNIRTYFFPADNYELWNVVELSPASVPTPSRRSGSYFWALAIILVSAFAIGVGGYLIVAEALDWSWYVGLAIGVVLGGGWGLRLDSEYIMRASPPDRPGYGRKHPPSGGTGVAVPAGGPTEWSFSTTPDSTASSDEDRELATRLLSRKPSG